LLDFTGRRSSGHADALAILAALPDGNDDLIAGKAELREVLETVRILGVPERDVVLNCSIARGLDYYTGTVYETTLEAHPQIGSICSGGRYENLASHYTKSRLPGVGISIGATRLFWQLSAAGLLGRARSTVKVLVTLMDAALLPACAELANALRIAGINTELSLEPRKLAKQLQYADRAGIAFALILGDDELARGTVQVKDLVKGEQFEVARAELVPTLKVELEQASALEAIGVRQPPEAP
jgi:histidyl-tRNA synthetase